MSGNSSKVDPDSMLGIFARFAKLAPLQAQLLAGSGLLLATTILFFGRDGGPVTVLSVAFIVLILSVLVAAMAGAASKGDTLSKTAAWAIAGIGICVVAIFAYALVTGKPKQAANILADILNSNAIIRADDDPDTLEIRAGMRPEQINELLVPAFTLPSEESYSDRVRSVKNSPAIRVIDADLDLSADPRQLTVSRIELSNATLIIGEQNKTIVTNDLQSNAGSIVAFKSTAPSGVAGASGKSAGDLTLEVIGKFSGNLAIDLSGRNGNKGAAGQRGAPGTNGAQGSHAASGAFDCRRGAGRGGDGGRGGTGGVGGLGGNGGNGGILTLIGVPAEAVTFTADGGTAGEGGVGGPGGPGGAGGPGGSPRGLCSGSGPRGADGPVGAAGPDGPNGQPGRNGQLRSNS